jgi:hypothetical protein
LWGSWWDTQLALHSKADSAEIAESDRAVVHGVWQKLMALPSYAHATLPTLGCPHLKFWFLFSYCLWGGCYSDGTDCVLFFWTVVVNFAKHAVHGVRFTRDFQSSCALFFWHHFGSSSAFLSHSSPSCAPFYFLYSMCHRMGPKSKLKRKYQPRFQWNPMRI